MDFACDDEANMARLAPARVPEYCTGPCRSCGDKTHDVISCLERPWKLDSKWTNKVIISPDEKIDAFELDDNVRKDGWYGTYATSFDLVIERFEAQRKYLKEQRLKKLEESNNNQSGEGEVSDEDDLRIDKATRETALPKIKYEEDVRINDHTSVWGSWWKDHQWGYKCCKQTIWNSYCTGAAGIEDAEAASDLMKANIARKEASEELPAPSEEKRLATWRPDVMSCMERPRKLGTKWTNKVIMAPNEKIDSFELDDRRDGWYGTYATSFDLIIERFEAQRKCLKEQQLKKLEETNNNQSGEGEGEVSDEDDLRIDEATRVLNNSCSR